MKHVGGLLMLNNMLDRLPASERKVAQFILEQPEQFLQLTAKELGERTSTSAPAVVRLCKSIGLKGIQDLKLRITGDIATVFPTMEFRDIEKDEPFAQVVQKVAMNIHRTIDETTLLVQENKFETCVQYIEQADQVFVFGMGASSLIADDLKQKLQRIHQNMSTAKDLHNAVTNLASFQSKDVLIAISNSGETNEVIDLITFAKRRGIRVITITQYGVNKVSQLADVALYTSSKFESTYRSGATSSRIAQLFIIDILFMNIVARNYEQTMRYIDLTREAISELKQIQHK